MGDNPLATLSLKHLSTESGRRVRPMRSDSCTNDMVFLHPENEHTRHPDPLASFITAWAQWALQLYTLHQDQDMARALYISPQFPQFHSHISQTEPHVYSPSHASLVTSLFVPTINTSMAHSKLTSQSRSRDPFLELPNLANHLRSLFFLSSTPTRAVKPISKTSSNQLSFV